MTISKTTMNHIYTAGTQAHEHRIRNSVWKVVRFILHLLEMLLAMVPGMAILNLLESLIPASSSYTAVFESGSNLYDPVMAVFMAVPMVGWMIVRGHGWHHGAEMAFGMIAPVAAIFVPRLLGADAYQSWLADISHPAMFLGMILAMLYRRDHYTGKAGHSE